MDGNELAALRLLSADWNRRPDGIEDAPMSALLRYGYAENRVGDHWRLTPAGIAEKDKCLATDTEALQNAPPAKKYREK
jgi:hypothetical protein